MKKFLMASIIAGVMAAFSSVAMASPLVTTNVPLDSRYYGYINKLEGMGYIKDMPTGTKPYSRLDMAKWIMEAQQVAADKPMPGYLKTYYEEMRSDLAEEIAYLQGDSKAYKSNIKLCAVEARLAYADMQQNVYRYRKGVNASWQPLNRNNNGYRYGDGINIIGTAEISGSLNKDLALNLTPRFSYDKDQNGDASIEAGYVKTHLGVWGIELGKQAVQWGGTPFAMSNNATPQTMLKLNLLEPHTFDNGFLKFLGKANVNVFYSRLEGNRVDKAHAAGLTNWNREKDHAGLLGVRVDIVPTENLTLGLERVSMFKSLNKDWILGTNAYDDDQWNDIGGIDLRYRFPGVQIYGSLYGEDQAGGFPSEHARSVGLYFPQLFGGDGSWDMRLELSDTNNWWYGHWYLVNGWTYKDDILGDAMGKNTRKYYGSINHYLANGDRIGLKYTGMDMDRDVASNPRVHEVQLTYAKKLNKLLYLDGVLGYAKIKNADYTSGRSDSSKLVAVGLRWEY